MRKKILLGLLAAVVVVGGVAGMSAYEAHVINVTAHIENALRIPTEAIEFGTVFPQEYVEKDFTIFLSDSFLDENQLRKGDIEYKIVQKPKCECDVWDTNPQACPDGEQYLPVDYATDLCPSGYTAMPDLCQFLSKLSIDGDNDVSVASYYNSKTDECSAPDPDLATGYLAKCHPAHVVCAPGDITDCWKVDLKVPPIEGSVGQDWPASCAGYTVPTDGVDYGCDLWIEVTNVSDLPQPPTSDDCGDGWITGSEQCESTLDCDTGYECVVCMCIGV